MTDSSKLTVKVSKGPPPACLVALCLDAVLTNIIKYLDNDAKLALITVLKGWRTVRYKIGYLHFDSVSRRYQAVDGPQRMRDDARQFFFSSITIREWWPIDTSDFQNLLDINLGNPSGRVERICLMGVDLRGVVVTPTALKTLTQQFSIEKLIIGKTTGFFENRVSLEAVVKLSVHNDPIVRLAWRKKSEEEGSDKLFLISWLCPQARLTLTSIILVNCPQWLVKQLVKFIKDNQVLTELSLVECYNIDSKFQIWLNSNSLRGSSPLLTD